MNLSYNVKDLLGDVNGLFACFAEENQFAPTRRGRLLVAMLMLAGVAMLIEEDKPSVELRRKLAAYFASCLSQRAGTEEFFHDLLGVRFGGKADFSVTLDATVN